MADMTPTRTEKEDLPQLRALFDGCAKTIATWGIDQWQDGYPQNEVILQDIAEGKGYAFRESGKILAAFTVFADGDPFYVSLGTDFWGDGKKHLALHRVAVDPALRQRGIGRAILDAAAVMAREAGCASMRIDTHRGNVPMRTMLEHYGFQLCGDMILPGGLPRVGYRYLLTK